MERSEKDKMGEKADKDEKEKRYARKLSKVKMLENGK